MPTLTNDQIDPYVKSVVAFTIFSVTSHLRYQIADAAFNAPYTPEGEPLTDDELTQFEKRALELFAQFLLNGPEGVRNIWREVNYHEACEWLNIPNDKEMFSELPEEVWKRGYDTAPFSS